MKTINLKCVVAFVSLLFPVVLSAQSQRETIRFNEGWKFAFGHAADATKDFGCGTEYFNYLTKANSIHNEGLIARSLTIASGSPCSCLTTM